MNIFDYKGIIFDLDGTLVDSMWIWEEIDKVYLNTRGFSVPENLKDEINHLSFHDTAVYFKNTYNLKDSVNEIMDTWHTMAYNHYKSNVPLKEGVLEFLTLLKTNNIKIALATSNSYPLLEACLQQNNIKDFFDVIVTTEEAGESKASPKVYIMAANNMNLKPDQCIVFEDIIEAVRGANLGGFTTIGVYDDAASYQKDLLIKECNKYITSFKELL